MAQWERELDNLGRDIQDIIDRAVNSQDYRKLNQTIRQTVELGSEAVRSAFAAAEKKKSSRPVKTVEAEVVKQQELALLYGTTGNLTTKGLVKAVGGGLLAAVSGLFSLASLILIFTGGSAVPTLLTLAGIGGGAGLIVSGVKNLSQVSRFKTYRKLLGNKTHVALDKLARSVGKTADFVRREVETMISRGLFRQGHLDREKTMLITSDETYRLFEDSRLQLEERKRQEEQLRREMEKNAPSPQVREVLRRGEEFLSEIRRCNDAIPGIEISDKISRMELIVQRIFQRAGTNPEIVPDLKKLMNYYLPMTVKLLNAYADMDAQPVQGETILSSKKEIEDTLDTLNLAFEKLLDSVFQDTALDVSSDISVLKTLLAQEGLTEKDFG
ncbi:MAG: 5-bromo-4-chloroindolyl phosphate hydrolysis protein [Ruminococcaceae bacterium]|nr:5-bromo-4-chloroindolyl phosphate hydrolysis protein [Oscillospiraceae bacterium]